MKPVSYNRHRFPPDTIRLAARLYFRFTTSLRDNNRAENSHLPVRRRVGKMQRFTSQGKAQCFVSTHSAIYNTRTTQRHLVSRNTPRIFRAAAFAQWNTASTAQR